MSDLDVKIPGKLLRFGKPARIKVAFGGRGGGKTESISRFLIALSYKTKINVLNAREFMNSIDDSVHSTHQKSINEMGLDSFFRVTNNTIVGKNGSKHTYGQLARNIQSIKSKNDVNICWVEEAETVTEDAIDTLEPTIRAAGSEIWYSFNPKDPESAVYKRYVEPYLDQIDQDGYYESDENGGLIVVKINLEDNKLAPKELHDQSRALKLTDPLKWRFVWGGEIQIDTSDDILIKADDVVRATRTDMVEKSGALIIGVDPARFGSDKTAIIRREGRIAHTLAKLDGQDTMQVAGLVALLIKLESPDAVFIDIGGLGAGIYDRLKELGYGDIVFGINFAQKSVLPDRFKNKRAEMWWSMKEWIEDAPVNIPNDNSLFRDLTTPKYKIDSSGRIQIESKEDIKKRINRSTDGGDALALTFAFPVIPQDIRHKMADVGFDYSQTGTSSGY